MNQDILMETAETDPTITPAITHPKTPATT